MLKQIEELKRSAALSQRRLLLFFGFAMMISNILLVIALYSKSEKVIVVPAALSKSFWVSEAYCSREYLEEMSTFFIGLVLDVTPHNVSFKRDMLLRYVDTESYGEIRNRLINEEKKLVEGDFSTSFRVQKIMGNPDKLEARVEGILIQYVAGVKVGETPEVYHIKYSNRGGTLLVTEFESEDA